MISHEEEEKSDMCDCEKNVSLAAENMLIEEISWESWESQTSIFWFFEVSIDWQCDEKSSHWDHL